MRPGELSEVTDHPAIEIENDTSRLEAAPSTSAVCKDCGTVIRRGGPLEFMRTLAALAVASKRVVRPRSRRPVMHDVDELHLVRNMAIGRAQYNRDDKIASGV